MNRTKSQGHTSEAGRLWARDGIRARDRNHGIGLGRLSGLLATPVFSSHRQEVARFVCGAGLGASSPRWCYAHPEPDTRTRSPCMRWATPDTGTCLAHWTSGVAPCPVTFWASDGYKGLSPLEHAEKA
jgi:hypothetical protein